MKKNYFLSFLLTLFISAFSFGQTAVITGYMDSPCTSQAGRTLEIYVDGTIDFTGWAVVRQSNGGGFDPGSATIDISALASVTDAFVYITNSSTTIDTEFGVTANVLENSNINGNGDDGWQILNSSSAIIDRFGVEGEDASGTAWDHLDSYAYRKDGATPNAGSFDASNWTFGGTNLLDGNCGSLSTFVPFGSYMATASSDPSIAITSPSDGQVFDASIADVAIMLAIQNFTLSADNGSGLGDNSGDGFVIGTSTKDGAPDGGNQNVFSLSAGDFNLDPGSSYTLTAELVDNAGNSLSPVVSTTISFSVELPCDLALDVVTTTCDALTSAVDNYTGSVTFTGGNTGITYTITAKDDMGNDVGTIGGDNPDSSATGTITVTGIPEGTEVDIKVVGGTGSSCDLTETLRSPFCKSFPVYESFDYTLDTDLIASDEWQDASTSSTPNNIQVIAGILGNPYGAGQFPDPVGGMANLEGSGSDPYIGFNATSTGTLYTSFIFSPTDVSTMTDTTDGGYFVALAESGGSFRARLYIRQTSADNTRYEIGISESGSATNFDTTLSYTAGEETFIVMSYELATNEIKVWANPDPATFEATPGTENLIQASGSTAADLGRFILRQDSAGETPNINFDELRIGTSWAEVTPKTATASVVENAIEGFATYPNPVNNKRFTVSTSTTNVKNVVLFNVLGKKVFSETFTGNAKELNVSALNSGIYILKVIEGAKIATKKLVIR
jgi:hypothetical protein